MRKKSLYTSAGLHVAIIVIATISIPWLRKDYDMPQPVSVEFAEMSKMTQTTKQAPVSKPPEKKEEKKEDPKPPPAAKNTSAEPAVPVKEDKKPEEDKKEEKKQLVDENAPPDKKKKDDKKKKQETTKEVKPKKDFSSVLKNLEDRKQTTPDKPQPDLKLDEPASSTADGQNAPLGSKLTMSEEDALRHQLQRCWNVPFGAKDAENLIVQIFMVIGPDRTLKSARIVDTARYNSDTFYRAAADSAMRAVRSPLCSPFELPPDKYDTWKETTVTFNPSEMF